jgi:hypothetical protein
MHLFGLHDRRKVKVGRASFVCQNAQERFDNCGRRPVYGFSCWDVNDGEADVLSAEQSCCLPKQFSVPALQRVTFRSRRRLADEGPADCLRLGGCRLQRMRAANGS